MAKCPKQEKSGNDDFEKWMRNVELKGDKLSRGDKLKAEQIAYVQRSVGNFVSENRSMLSAEHKRILDVFERSEYNIDEFLTSYEQVHGAHIEAPVLKYAISELDSLVQGQFILIEDEKIKINENSPWYKREDNQ